VLLSKYHFVLEILSLRFLFFLVPVRVPGIEPTASRVLGKLSTVHCSFSGQLLEPCGYIYPEFPVVQRGSNFTAICVLKEACLQHYYVNASYIVWKTNHAAVPREQVTVINRTTSSVTFTDVVLPSVQLTCNILSFGQIEQNVYGVTMLSGCKIWVFSSILSDS
jgi:hypothetical protein